MRTASMRIGTVWALAAALVVAAVAGGGAGTARAQEAAAPKLPGRVDLRQKMELIEKWRQQRYADLRAKGTTTAADFRRVDEDMLRIARKAEGFREEALATLNRNAGVEVRQGPGGTQPKQGRGLAGDIDTASMSARDFERLRKTAKDMGYTVTGQGDAITIEELNVTAHRQSAAEAGTASRTGSSASATEAARGLNEETALGFGKNNPSASVSDNLKKAAHTLDTPPADLTMADTQKLGKMAGRNLEELGRVAPGAADGYSTLQQQSRMLKEGYSPEAAGIVRDGATAAERAQDLANFQKQVREVSVQSVRATDEWAVARRGELGDAVAAADREVASAREMYERAKTVNSDPAHVQKTQQIYEQARAGAVKAREEMIGFNEVQAASKEAALASGSNGKSAAELMGEAKGIPKGEPPSVVREGIVGPERKALTGAAREPLPAGVREPVPSGVREPVAGRAAAAEAEGAEAAALRGKTGGLGSKLVKGGMGLAMVYGIYEGVKEGSAQAGEEAARNGDGATMSTVKTGAYTLWHGLGFGAATKIGTEAGQESAQVYAEGVKKGEIDPTSRWEKAWAMGRGALWGVSEFTGLTAIKNAAVEVGGLAVDRYGQYKAEKAAAGVPQLTPEQKAEQARKAAEAKEKAAAEAAAKAEEKAEAEREAREKAAEAARQAKLAGTGIHEEDAGSARMPDGTTIRFVYIRDAAGNTIETIEIHYDANGKEIRRFRRLETAEGLDGIYVGRFSGMAAGSFGLTIQGGSAKGVINGTSDGDAVNASMTGTVSPQGMLSGSVSGIMTGSLGGGKPTTWSFRGTMSGRVASGTASGAWTATGSGVTRRGTWSASR